jgi:hypothetical protein
MLVPTSQNALKVRQVNEYEGSKRKERKKGLLLLLIFSQYFSFMYRVSEADPRPQLMIRLI